MDFTQNHAETKANFAKARTQNQQLKGTCEKPTTEGTRNISER
jgi:hypothetical protein